MENILIGAAAVLVLFILFLMIRSILVWYYKINERIYLQNETNYLLEKIAIQLGADLEGITIQNIQTSEKIVLKKEEWLEYKRKREITEKAKNFLHTHKPVKE